MRRKRLIRAAGRGRAQRTCAAGCGRPIGSRLGVCAPRGADGRVPTIQCPDCDGIGVFPDGPCDSPCGGTGRVVACLDELEAANAT